MTYKEYKKARKEVIEDIKNETYFTKEHYEKLQEKMKKEKIFENKIDKLAEEYLSIMFCDFPKENAVIVNFSHYGYYVILEYCLKQLKLNDKNLMNGFSMNLANR